MADANLNINANVADAINEIKKFSASASKSLANIEKSSSTLDNSFKDVGKAATDANKSVSNLGGTLKSGAKLLAGFAAGFAGLNLAKKAVSNLSAFGDAVAEIGTVAGDSIAINAEFRESLIGVASEFGTDAASQAKSFYSIVSAGITDASAAQEALTAANQLATGGLASTEQSIDILTSALNSFKGENLGAKDAADILFSTVQSGKTTVSELAASFGQSFSAAASLGFTFKEAAAGLADLTTKGNNTATATTKLKSLFNSFIGVQSKLSGQSKELNDAFDLSTIKQRGLQQVLLDIQNATGGSVIKLQELLGSTEAVSAFTSIASGEFQNFNDILAKDTAGAAESAADKIKNTLGFQLNQLQSNFGNLVLKLTLGGEDESVSTLKSVNDLLKQAIENSEDLAAAIKLIGVAAASTFAIFKLKNIIIGFGALTKSIATSKIVMDGLKAATIAYNVAGGGVAGVTAVFKGLTTAIRTAAISTKGLKLAFKGLLVATGIGLIIIAVTELIQLFLELKDEVGGFGNATRIVFESVKGTLAEIGKGIIGIFENIPFIGDKFKDQFDSAKATLQEIVDESAKTVADIKIKAELDKLGVGKAAKAAADTAEKVIADNPPVITPIIDPSKVAAEAEKAKKLFDENLKLADFQLQLDAVGKSADEVAKIDLAKQIRDQNIQVNELLKQGTINASGAAELRLKISNAANIKIGEIEKKAAEDAKKISDDLAAELKKNDDKKLADAKTAFEGEQKARNDQISRVVKFATDLQFGFEQAFSAITGLSDEATKAILDGAAKIASQAGALVNGAIGVGASALSGVGATQSDVAINDSLATELASIQQALIAGELTAAQAAEKRFDAETKAQEELGKLSENNLKAARDSIGGVANDLVSTVAPALGGVVGGLLDVLSLPPDALAAQLEGFVDAIPAFISRIAENLPTLISSLAKGLISTLVDAVPKLISQLADIVPELLIGLVDAITSPTFIDSLIAAVAKFITAIINALPRIITSIVKAIPVIIKAIAKELPGIIVAIVRAIPEIINAIILAIPDIILSLVEAIPIIIQGLIEALPELFPELINGAIEALPLIIVAFVKLIPQIIVALAKGIFGIFQSLGSIITNVFSQAGGNLVSGISDAVKNFGSNITNGATTFINKFLEIPGKFLTSLIDGLKDGISKVFEDLDPTGGGGFAGVFGGGGGLFGQGGGGLGLGGGTGLGFAKGIGEVPPGFPNDTLSARLSSGERVVPSDTNNQLQNFLNREEQGGGRTEQLLVEIASLLDQPMSVKTTAEVNGQAFADIFLEMRRNNARLLA